MPRGSTRSKSGPGDICSRPHPNTKCWSLVKIKLSQRPDVIKKHGLCFRCLCKGHLASNCSVACSGCKGDHHILVCRKSRSSNESKSDNGKPVSNVTLANKSNVDKSLLETAVVQVRGGRGSVKARILFDSGADWSYVFQRFVRRC